MKKYYFKNNSNLPIDDINYLYNINRIKTNITL